MKTEGSSGEGTEYYPYQVYPPPPPTAPHPPPPAREEMPYGTFEGTPAANYQIPPGFPHPVHPSQAPRFNHGVPYDPVPGYPIVEGTPVERLHHHRLPCCGLGFGWFLFIIGFFLATIPWYVGAFSLICFKHDPRERVGLICCAIAVVISIIAALVGTRGADVW